MVERGIDVHPQQVDFLGGGALPAAVAMACTIFGKPSCRWVAMPSSTLRPAIAGNARGCTEDVGAVESTARRSESPGVYVLQHVVIPTNSGALPARRAGANNRTPSGRAMPGGIQPWATSVTRTVVPSA